MGDQVCEKTGSKPCRENVEFLMDHGYEVYDYRQCQAARHEVMSSYSYDNLGNMLNKAGTSMSYGAGNAGPHARLCVLLMLTWNQKFRSDSRRLANKRLPL